MIPPDRVSGEAWERAVAAAMYAVMAGPGARSRYMKVLAAAAPHLLAETRTENDRLRAALTDIVNASRDDGLAVMCNWMRGRALAALDREGEKDGD